MRDTRVGIDLRFGDKVFVFANALSTRRYAFSSSVLIVSDIVDGETQRGGVRGQVSLTATPHPRVEHACVSIIQYLALAAALR